MSVGERENDKELLRELPVTDWARIESLEKIVWRIVEITTDQMHDEEQA